MAVVIQNEIQPHPERRRMGPRRTITLGWADYMDGPEPMRPNPTTSHHARRCICCGAPETEVSHD